MSVYKKSQVILFFAVGIVILLSISLMVYLITTTNELKQDKTRQEIVRFNVLPIEKYVKNCMINIAKNTIYKVALQGGYSNVNQSFLSIGFIKIPFWYFHGRDISPQKSEIENQIAKTLENNIDICLGQFEPLKIKYRITPLAPPEAKVSILSNAINIELDYPLEISTKKDTKKKSYIRHFKTIIKIPLGEMFLLAKKINNLEKSERVYEKIAKEIASLSLPKDQIYLTPIEKVWSIEKLRKKFASALTMYLPLVKYFNSSAIGYYKNFLVPINSQQYKKYEIQTLYLKRFGLWFDAQPKKSGFMHTISTKFPSVRGIYMPLPFLQIGHFLYSYEFPILVSIIDNNTGLNFMFAVDVSVANNKPKQYNQLFKQNLDVALDNICNTKGTQVIIYVYDKLTGKYLQNVSVSYFCGSNCFQGITDYDTFNGMRLYNTLPKLKSTLPKCDNGFIVLKAKGYKTKYIQFTSDHGSKDFDIALTPMKSFQIKFDSILLPREKVYLSVSSKDIKYNLIYNSSTKVMLPAEEQNLSINAFVLRNEKIVGGYFTDGFNVDIAKFINKKTLVIPLFINRTISNEETGNYLYYILNNASKTKLPKFE